MLLQVRLKIAALTPRERYAWKLNFLKLFLNILLELSQKIGRGPHILELSLTSLEQLIPLYIRIKFLLFFLPGTAFVGDQENSSSWTPALHFWGQGLCAAHQGIAGRDALHESTSGGWAGGSENVLIWVCFSCYCPSPWFPTSIPLGKLLWIIFFYGKQSHALFIPFLSMESAVLVLSWEDSGRQTPTMESSRVNISGLWITCSWKHLWFPPLLPLHEHSQLMDKHRRKVGPWTKLDFIYHCLPHLCLDP